MGKHREGKGAWQRAMEIVPLIASLVAIIFTIFNYFYNSGWDESAANIESYRDKLNYDVTWEGQESELEAQLRKTEPLRKLKELPNQNFSVQATTGGIKSVKPIYYFDGTYYGIIEPPLDPAKTIDRSENTADYWALKSTTLKLYAFKENADAYYSCIYLLVEGYNGERDLRAIVFEFDADEKGEPKDECRIREYKKEDILHLHNDPELELIPKFDAGVLKDYACILKTLEM